MKHSIKKPLFGYKQKLLPTSSNTYSHNSKKRMARVTAWPSTWLAIELTSRLHGTSATNGTKVPPKSQSAMCNPCQQAQRSSLFHRRWLGSPSFEFLIFSNSCHHYGQRRRITPAELAVLCQATTGWVSYRSGVGGH